MTASAQIKAKLFSAADNHGANSEPGHTVGDLQDLFSACWSLMTASQKIELLQSSTIADLAEAGADGKFTHDDLANDLRSELLAQENEMTKAGYVFLEGDDGFYWEDSAGRDSLRFPTHYDAIADAYSEYTA